MYELLFAKGHMLQLVLAESPIPVGPQAASSLSGLGPPIHLSIFYAATSAEYAEPSIILYARPPARPPKRSSACLLPARPAHEPSCSALPY